MKIEQKANLWFAHFVTQRRQNPACRAMSVGTQGGQQTPGDGVAVVKRRLMKVLGTNPSSAHRQVLLVAQQPLQSCYKLLKISHSHPNIFKEVGTVLFPEGKSCSLPVTVPTKSSAEPLCVPCLLVAT